MDAIQSLFIPVILGTARMGRMSLHAAQLVTGELGKRAGIRDRPHRYRKACPANKRCG